MAANPMKGFFWLFVLWLAVATGKYFKLVIIFKLIFPFTCVVHIVFTRIEATVTLTAPSSPPCFGQPYKLTCTHPVPDADTNVRWERNGTGFNPQSTPNHDLVDVTDPTTTTLTINVTREEFENKVYTYRCFTYDGNVGFNDPNRTISNEVTVDPPGEYILTDSSLVIAFTVFMFYIVNVIIVSTLYIVM